MSQSQDPSAAVERVAELTPDAADLLCLCAFLDPAHPVPVAALDAGADALPAPLAAAPRPPARPPPPPRPPRAHLRRAPRRGRGRGRCGRAGAPPRRRGGGGRAAG